CKKIRKKEKMLARLEKPKKHKNLAYMNHSIKTNPAERKDLYQMFKDKPWVTIDHGGNGHRFDEYIDNVYNHKFVFCPEGNGMDTHRTWETLYMGTIPIEKRNVNNQFYTNLPICFVDDWKQVTKTFLEKEYARIKSVAWNMEKLEFKYWKDKIRTYADFVNTVNAQHGSGWSTHQAVLFSILKKVNKSVLELGAGEFSTVQIHDALKDRNVKVLTIESDKEWLNKYEHLKTDLHTLQYIQDIEKFYAKDNEQWELVFIDNNYTKDSDLWWGRKSAISKYKDVADYIVLHDCDAILDKDNTFGEVIKPIDPGKYDPGVRDYSKTFAYWIEFFVDGWKQWHPPTLLASNKVCLNDIKSIDGMIIANRNK
ncbi:MAG: hypothetical protein ACTSQN_18140, partial [Candidatus Heimdallarchaeota archaeon]